MKRNIYSNTTIVLSLICLMNCFADSVDLTEPMKESLVYLDISKTSYDLSQPWKQTPIAKKSGYGCAVSPYEVLTIAENVSDATYVQARVYGSNTYIPATVKTVDYEYNLCLLELDKNAMSKPLTPLSFKKLYPKDKQLTAYWLSSGNHLTTARTTLDRAEMNHSFISFAINLTFIATNVSRPFGDGQVCCYENDPIGITAWGTESDAGIIPTEMIECFLSQCREDTYRGFASAGFRISALLDPSMRKYLKVPEDIKYGAYVKDVYTVGTGSGELKVGDVILSINGLQLNSYGRYEHPEYKQISFHHILLQTPVGEDLSFEIVRDGKLTTLNIPGIKIESDNMLIPYYLYGKMPEYVVVGGYIFQQLSRDYMGIWGSHMSGTAPPHLYHYEKDLSFKPSEDREDIVILSYVLPSEINLGYQQISQLVVDSVNGVKIISIKHFSEVIEQSESDEIAITFEMDSPVLVIPKDILPMENYKIATLYGITSMMNINE